MGPASSLAPEARWDDDHLPSFRRTVGVDALAEGEAFQALLDDNESTPVALFGTAETLVLVRPHRLALKCVSDIFFARLLPPNGAPRPAGLNGCSSATLVAPGVELHLDAPSEEELLRLMGLLRRVLADQPINAAMMTHWSRGVTTFTRLHGAQDWTTANRILLTLQIKEKALCWWPGRWWPEEQLVPLHSCRALCATDQVTQQAWVHAVRERIRSEPLLAALSGTALPPTVCAIIVAYCTPWPHILQLLTAEGQLATSGALHSRHVI